MFCTWNVGDMFHRRYPKKEIQSIRVLCFGIGGILLHLWQRNQSLYSMLGGLPSGQQLLFCHWCLVELLELAMDWYFV